MSDIFDVKRGDVITVTRDDETRRFYVMGVWPIDDFGSVMYDLVPAVEA